MQVNQLEMSKVTWLLCAYGNEYGITQKGSSCCVTLCCDCMALSAKFIHNIVKAANFNKQLIYSLFYMLQWVPVGLMCL